MDANDECNDLKEAVSCGIVEPWQVCGTAKDGNRNYITYIHFSLTKLKKKSCFLTIAYKCGDARFLQEVLCLWENNYWERDNSGCWLRCISPSMVQNSWSQRESLDFGSIESLASLSQSRCPDNFQWFHQSNRGRLREIRDYSWAKQRESRGLVEHGFEDSV